MLHFNRQELLSSDEAARLRELAKHILQEIVCDLTEILYHLK
jgi:hypothetical protein